MKIEVNLNESYKLLHPRPVAIICSISINGKINIMACSWITPISDEPPLIAISLWSKGYTHKLIDETGEFTVNIPSINLLDKVWLAGTKSGSKIDKVKLLKLSLKESKKVKPPIIDECIGNLECKVRNKIVINEQILYIAEILKAYIEESLFKDNIMAKEANILHHVSGKFFAIVTKYLKAK